MILMIDNYDSFTYNLYQMFQMMGREVQVLRNDQASLSVLEGLNPSALVISPGPSTPAEAGISIEAIRFFGPVIPVLGVCLGHQAIAAAFGGKVTRADRIMHGKTSPIHHDCRRLFQGLPETFHATRYHSLIVDRESLPDCLQIGAWTEEGEIMGIRHRHLDVEGIQFHPESIITEFGGQIIKNFIQLEKGGNGS
jgi:anthranilate synthase/aminodeoxychorismate synthase-like glutamine amidotransferase